MSHLPSFLAKYLSDTTSGVVSRSLAQPGSRSWREATGLRSYFSDLLAYTLQNLVKDTGGGTPAALTAAELSALLHQPFEALLASGGVAERPVRQVRLVIEAMRRLLGNRPLSDNAKENALAEAEAAWRSGAYDTILSLLGVSVATMADLSNADEATRKALAARLGIAPGQLAEFYQPAASVTETWLEQHFGLMNTSSAGFSTGVKIGDTKNQITHWELEGIEWDTGTDNNGLVYLRLSKPNTNTFLVEVFKDANRSILLASGSSSTAQGMVTLNAYEDSKAGGVVHLNYADGGTSILMAVVPKLLAYRYQLIRQRWQALYSADDAEGLKFLDESILAARQNIEDAVGKAELYGLPVLRDALAAATGQDVRYLSERLLLDCAFDASFITSRTASAIATLQQLLGGLRTGLLRDTFPQLQFQHPEFDNEWTWLGTYEDWKSAILVFLYPENALEPTLRNRQTPAFRKAVESLSRDRQLGGDTLRKVTGEYETYFRDICQLEVEATCHAITELGAGNEAALRNIFYLFGRAKNGVYWSATDITLPLEEQQSCWEAIPGFEALSTTRLLGAIPYRTLEGKRLLYLFALGIRKSGFSGYVYSDNMLAPDFEESLAYTTYDLQERKWAEKITFLSKPGAETVVVEQRLGDQYPPHVIIKNSQGIHSRHFNPEGTDWADAPWKTIHSGAGISEIHGICRVANKYQLSAKTTEDAYNGFLRLYNFNSSENHINTTNIVNADFIGAAIYYPVTIFYFYKRSGNLFYRSIKIATTNQVSAEIAAPAGIADLGVSNGMSKEIVQVGNVILNMPKDGFRLAYKNTSGQQGYYQAFFTPDTNNKLAHYYPAQVLPYNVSWFDLTPSTMNGRKQGIANAFEQNSAAPRHVLNYLWESYYFFPHYLSKQLERSHQYPPALDYLRLVYDYSLPISDRKIFFGLQLESSLPLSYERPADWLSDALNPHDIAATRQQTYTRYTLLTLVRCFLQAADAEFTRDTAESLATARTYYAAALELLDSPELQPRQAAWGLQFDVPMNPLPDLLRHYAELNLYKLHNGRNIAGDEREIPLLEDGGASLMPMSSLNGHASVIVPTTSVQRPTPYRFVVLLERAKQLTGMAQQMEAAFLSALEKLDAEQLQALHAKHELQTAKATVRLQDLRVKEARDGVRLAESQKEKSITQRNHFQQLIEAGLSNNEEKGLEAMKDAGRWGLFGGVLAGAAAFATGGVGLIAGGAAIASGISGAVSSNSNYKLTLANFERREQDWKFQRDLSNHDIRIGDVQIRLAQDQVQIVGQERNIAALRSDQASAVANFLATKFTNADLYDFISDVLEGVYSFFLQQATATAQLTAQQLAFERQEPVPAVVLGDYWAPPSPNGNSSAENPDRRGMTGSARLLRDIQRLDQIAFQTDQRKLQLSKTISLAQLSPVEFQRFRETGVLPVHIAMEAFDRDFPGHYLRLIRQVKVSLLALVPPLEGIKATLTHNGISRVVLPGNGQFAETVIRRPPESIAFTAPLNANGLFEMQPDPGKLMPFESMGVDGFWEFQLPKAANAFDYSSIADVLITLEYTALSNTDYRRRVIANLDRRFSADRAFSFRRDFPDQWYDLNHPEQSNEPMVVQFETLRGDFPANIEGLDIRQVVLYVARKDGFRQEIKVRRLRYQPEGGVWLGGADDQNLDTVNGILSTRTGSFADWDEFRGKTPVGEWELALTDSTEIRQWFKEEQITDVLFVLTLEGETAAWA